jgi:anti-anti-sigma regulatory factor
MHAAQVRIHVNESRAGWVVLELLGEFSDDAERPIDEYLMEMVAAGAVTVVVDATRLTSIGARPCQSLVAAACSLDRLRGEVLVTRPPDQLRQMLERLGGADRIRIVAGGPPAG